MWNCGHTTPSNHSTWRVADICSVGSCNLAPAYGRPDGSAPGYNMQVLVGDTFYFDAFIIYRRRIVGSRHFK